MTHSISKAALILVLSATSASSVFADSHDKSSGKNAGKHADFKAKQHALAPEISLQELRSLVENKDKKSIAIIDANSEKTYKEGHIPGALNFAQIEKDLSKALPSDKSALIVAYCGSTMCTAWEDAAKKVKELGYTNVKHLKVGIKGWKEAKYPTQI